MMERTSHDTEEAGGVRVRWSYPVDPRPPDDEIRRRFAREAGIALRTRMTPVSGYAQLLHRQLHGGAGDREQLTRNVDALTHEVEELRRRTLGFLDALYVGWDGSLAWQPVDLPGVARMAAQRATEQLHASGRRIVLDLDDDINGIWDQRWLIEAISAIIANALCYSPDDSEIHIRARREDDHALVVVRDSGIGIPEDEQSAIFEPFYRGRLVAATTPGLGLGLFVAGRVTESLGGVIDVESGQGIGSEFRIALPLIPPPDRDQAQLSAD